MIKYKDMIQCACGDNIIRRDGQWYDLGTGRRWHVGPIARHNPNDWWSKRATVVLLDNHDQLRSMFHMHRYAVI